MVSPAPASLSEARLAELKLLTTQVRRDILRMVYGVSSGHPGGSMGCTEYFVALYFHLLRHNPTNWHMDGVGEDLFFLSNGHISPVFYSVLARSGYFPVAELATFRKLDSRLQGHPATKEHLPGVRVATGSLGQGLSVAVGAAMAKKFNHDKHLVYCLTGDGELNEGQIWEALLFAAHHNVDNLIVTVDWNGIQIDGNTSDVMDMGDLQPKFAAFGWEVVLLEQGNDLQHVVAAHQEAQRRSGQGKPVVVLMKSTVAHGVDFMAGDFNWHGKSPNADQFNKAMAQLLLEQASDY